MPRRRTVLINERAGGPIVRPPDKLNERSYSYHLFNYVLYACEGFLYIFLMNTRTLHGKDVVLPQHMFSLAQEEIDLIDCVDSIIACGVDPQDGALYVVAADARVCRITPNGSLRPEWAIPYDLGARLQITFLGLSEVHTLDSRVVLQNAESCIDSIDLLVKDTYVGTLRLGVDDDNKVVSAQEDNS